MRWIHHQSCVGHVHNIYYNNPLKFLLRKFGSILYIVEIKAKFLTILHWIYERRLVFPPPIKHLSITWTLGFWPSDTYQEVHSDCSSVVSRHLKYMVQNDIFVQEQ